MISQVFVGGASRCHDAMGMMMDYHKNPCGTDQAGGG